MNIDGFETNCKSGRKSVGLYARTVFFAFFKNYLFLFLISVILISCRSKSLNYPEPLGNNLAGQSKDRNTVALWLFDESAYPNATLLDASIYEIADLALTSGILVPGKYGNALTSSPGYNLIYAGYAGNGALSPRGPDGFPSGLWGPTYASEALNNGLDKKDYTFEFWLNLLQIPERDAFIFDMGKGFKQGFSIILKQNATSVTIDNFYAGVASDFKLPSATEKNGFIHYLFAMSKDGKGTLFIDGKKRVEASVRIIEKVSLPDIENPRNNFMDHRGWPSQTLSYWQENRFNLSILEDRKAENILIAHIDEIRVSDTIRTTDNFIPGTYSKNYSESPYLLSGITGLPQLLSPDVLSNYNSASNPLEFGARKHLFIDDKIIEAGTMQNLKITPNKLSMSDGEKTDITKVDGEWRITFAQDEDRMLAIATANYNSSKGMVYLYETNDGLHFSGKQVSMVNYPMGGDLFIDSSSASLANGTKFKLTSYVGNRGICLYTSPDAFNWRRNEVAMLPLLSGGSAESFYDDQTGYYVTYLKRDASTANPVLHMRASVRFTTQDPYRPWPFIKLDTPYFENSPFPAASAEGEIQFVFPDGLKTDEQVYRTRVIKYPYAPDTYLGFPWIYHHNTNDRDLAMAASRDGNDWQIIGKPYYVDKGNYAEAISCQGLLRKGNELWQYIEFGDDHGSGERSWYRFKQRLDGFFSLDAGNAEGRATTKSLNISGTSLFVNYKSGTNGYLKILIQDETGDPFNGFEESSCILLNGDSLSEEVRWEAAQFSSLKNKNIKITFILKNTKLYGFEIKE